MQYTLLLSVLPDNIPQPRLLLFASEDDVYSFSNQGADFCSAESKVLGHEGIFVGQRAPKHTHVVRLQRVSVSSVPAVRAEHRWGKDSRSKPRQSPQPSTTPQSDCQSSAQCLPHNGTQLERALTGSQTHRRPCLHARCNSNTAPAQSQPSRQSPVAPPPARR